MVWRFRKRFGYDPFDDIFYSLEESINRSIEETRRILTNLLRGIPIRIDYVEPLVDIRDEGDKYVIEVELPGVSKEDIQLYASEGYLEILAESRIAKEEKDKGYIRRERKYLGFRRIIPLPEDADPEKIEAEYKDGILKITIGKVPEAKTKRKIDIK